MKKIALSILLLELFCSVTHAGVVDLQFQYTNSEAYAEADTQGGLNYMFDPHSAYVDSYWEEMLPEPAPPMIFMAHAQADISYSQGSSLIQSINSLLFGNADVPSSCYHPIDLIKRTKNSRCGTTRGAIHV